ncbi:hypothetical protein GOP47_0012871 [Adiantum capillus-veneris]|uniref:Uncharacterized protein n=1 Tax=Adiantum capillus-veneris TaxID=13818 RepID=A0A9D4URI0_ADICA|nr:hypothetical protein GOP47_0012871 [Adiantum capillus-veneris]
MEANGVQKKEYVLVQAPMVLGMQEDLEQRYDVIRLWDDSQASLLQDAAPYVRALVSFHKLPLHLLESLPNLAIISNHGVGIDHIDLDYCCRHGIRVTNTPDVLNDDVADLAILFMLAVRRHLCEADQFVRSGQWVQQMFPLARKASGLRLGIFGLGRIGMAIAKRAESFDNIVAYHGRSKKPGVSYPFYSKLSELAANSDVLVVACPLTEDTKHIVGKEVLDALGPEGTLINIARGPVVDESALVEALVEKRLGGAGLDVFENEPHVPKELLSMNNVVLSPHAGSATWETRHAMAKLVLDNLHAFFAGKPLLTPIL